MFEQALDSRTVLLIRELSKRKEITDHFYLAGGTGLALHFGHRKSDDVDLFSTKPFSVERYSQIIDSLGGRIMFAEEGTIHGIACETKISLLHYPYHLLGELQPFKGLQVASIEDIACMKAVAVSQRGEKKDFFDLFEILNEKTPSDIKSWLVNKYGEKKDNLYHILKSFFYFTDAEESPDPISLNGTTWENVKEGILEKEKELAEAFLSE